MIVPMTCSGHAQSIALALSPYKPCKGFIGLAHRVGLAYKKKAPKGAYKGLWAFIGKT